MFPLSMVRSVLVSIYPVTEIFTVSTKRSRVCFTSTILSFSKTIDLSWTWLSSFLDKMIGYKSSYETIGHAPTVLLINKNQGGEEKMANFEVCAPTLTKIYFSSYKI